MNQDARKAEPLLHTAAQCADERALLFAEADQFQNVVDCLFALSGRDFVACAEEIQIFGHFHVFVDTKEIGHVTDHMPHGIGITNNIMAENLRSAG